MQTITSRRFSNYFIFCLLEQSIYPFEHLQLKHYPNSSLVISWRHAKKVNVQYYVIQFRELIERNGSIDSKPWRSLAYIKSENFKNQDVKLLEIQEFSYDTLYEMNLGIFSNDNVIASVSILHDRWRAESFQGTKSNNLIDCVLV